MLRKTSELVKRTKRLASRAGVLGGLIALSLAPAGCGDASKPSIDELLQAKAGPVCTNAVDASGSPPAPGSVAKPAVTMFANDTSGLDEKFGGRPGPAAFYAYYRSLVPTRAAPDSVEAVKTVVCVREAPVVVGIYKAQDSSVTKEIAAVRLDWHVRVLNWPSGETIASTIFQGGEPPSAMSRTTDRMYPTEGGLAPSSEAEQWIDGLIAQ